jgi:hypothetical protein
MGIHPVARKANAHVARNVQIETAAKTYEPGAIGLLGIRRCCQNRMPATCSATRCAFSLLCCGVIIGSFCALELNVTTKA